MASTSAKQTPLPTKEPVATNYVQYPPPAARYEEVVGDAKIFINALEKFHAAMGTKFMIPIIGGKELDLHRLFVEVTSRGGIEKIIREKRWREVTAIFNFPATATNASFVLRKYYGSLLQHFEQLYYFRARGWTPTSAAPSQSPLMTQSPAQVTVQPSPQNNAAAAQQSRTNTSDVSGARVASTASSPVMGVIDGKFESGYLVTVTIGSETLRGVLYQAPEIQSGQVLQQYSVPANSSGGVLAGSGTQRRRRRKKSEIKRRDPGHPKPNRSGYNFFFAEQHARLKPLHPGKDREISRMIGELWNKLNDSEKTVYQEIALKDKERYKIEMEDYRERLRTGRVISNAVPLQQWLPMEKDTDMVDVDVKDEENEGGDSAHTMDNESCSGGGSEYEDDDKAGEKDLNMEESRVVADCGNINSSMDVEIPVPATADFDQTRKVGGVENAVVCATTEKGADEQH